jgi:hypothetical protein
LGSPEVCCQLFADVPSYKQGDKGTDRGTFEPGGHLMQAFVDHARIELAVELFMHEMCDGVQFRVDPALNCAGVNRRRIGHIQRWHCRVRSRKICCQTLSFFAERAGARAQLA